MKLFVLLTLFVSFNLFAKDTVLCTTKNIYLGSTVKKASKRCVADGNPEDRCLKGMTCMQCTYFESKGYAGDTAEAAAKSCAKYTSHDFENCLRNVDCRN